jgi:hypothetical protein
MSFRQFRGIWWVRTASDGEEEGHRVAIGGRPGNVTIICIDEEVPHAFGKAQYNAELDQIEVDRNGSPYVITMGITCRPVSQVPNGPGSWTAEDTAGGQKRYGDR